jgi:uncharacterized phage protein (TIGR02216 family)
MRLAFTSWRMSPAAFWAMTPREVAAALGRPSDLGFDRTALGELMRRFPDR